VVHEGRALPASSEAVQACTYVEAVASTVFKTNHSPQASSAKKTQKHALRGWTK
jgi:hypothetical protein